MKQDDGAGTGGTGETGAAPLPWPDGGDDAAMHAIAAARAAMRDTCRDAIGARLSSVALVIALRTRWQAIRHSPEIPSAIWDRLYTTMLGECLREHFESGGAVAVPLPRGSRSVHQQGTAQAATVRERAEALIARAAVAMANAAARRQHQVHLLEELTAQRAALRALMTDFGRELRAANVPRPRALELIGVATDQPKDRVNTEQELMAREAFAWGVAAYDAAA